MPSLSSKTIFFLLCATLCITACSGNSEEEEKSSIDTFTEETAQKAVQYIKEPLDKARDVQDLANQHSQQMQQAIEEAK